MQMAAAPSPAAAAPGRLRMADAVRTLAVSGAALHRDHANVTGAETDDSSPPRPFSHQSGMRRVTDQNPSVFGGPTIHPHSVRLA